MNYTAIIEIPKGCDRRIHKSIETGEFTDFGPTKEVIPVNDGKMPVTYGFIKNTLNKDEGDEIDVLVFSKKEYKTEDEVSVRVIGLLVREDGDHKVVAVDETEDFEAISDIPTLEWQEIRAFFEYKHKITEIQDAEAAESYLSANMIANSGD